MNRFLRGIVFPVAFAGIVLLIATRGGRFEFDEDEGLNLMKAALVSDGHPLYQSVWSDQPPWMTWMLAVGLKLFGESVWVGRGMVLFFSVLLLWSVGRIGALLHGELAGWIAMALLAASFNYARMSLSVMIGLPAIAMATASLWLLLVWRSRPMPRQTADVYLLGASAVLFAAGLLTKMFVAEMLPVAMVAFFVPMGERGRPGGWIAAWVFIVAGLFGAGCAAGRMDFTQTIGTHLHSLAAGEGRKVLVNCLRHDWYLIVLAVMAVVFARAAEVLIAGVWVLVSIGVVLVHQPLWYHHMLLVSVPLVWIAAHGLAALWMRQRTVALVVMLMLAVYWPIKVWREAQRLRAPAAAGDWEIVAALREGKGKWVFADRPMYAFYARKRVPPEVAVLSVKRMSGEKMDALVADALERYRPDRVEIGRFAFGEPVGRIISDEYGLGLTKDRARVYVRK